MPARSVMLSGKRPLRSEGSLRAMDGAVRLLGRTLLLLEVVVSRSGNRLLIRDETSPRFVRELLQSGKRSLLSDDSLRVTGGMVRLFGVTRLTLANAFSRAASRLLSRAEMSSRSTDGTRLVGAGSGRLDSVLLGERLLRTENELVPLLGEGIRLLGSATGVLGDKLPRDRLLPVDAGLLLTLGDGILLPRDKSVLSGTLPL